MRCVFFCRYIKALGHLAKLVHVESTMKEEDHAQAKALKLSCCNNLAQCFLKLEMWSKAIDNCTMALELDPDNAKALFRRAQAYVEGKDHELAVKDLKRLGTTSSPHHKPSNGKGSVSCRYEWLVFDAKEPL